MDGRAGGGGVHVHGPNPYQRLDAVFVSRDVDVVRAGVPTDLVSKADKALASDHRPVLAVVRI